MTPNVDGFLDRWLALDHAQRTLFIGAILLEARMSPEFAAGFDRALQLVEDEGPAADGPVAPDCDRCRNHGDCRACDRPFPRVRHIAATDDGYETGCA